MVFIEGAYEQSENIHSVLVVYFINSWHIAGGVFGTKHTRLFYPVAAAVPVHV